jgi:hypothetical protein
MNRYLYAYFFIVLPIYLFTTCINTPDIITTVDMDKYIQFEGCLTKTNDCHEISKPFLDMISCSNLEFGADITTQCVLKNKCITWEQRCPKCNNFPVSNALECLSSWVKSNCLLDNNQHICSMQSINLTSCSGYTIPDNCKCKNICTRRPKYSLCKTMIDTSHKCVNVFRWPILPNNITISKLQGIDIFLNTTQTWNDTISCNYGDDKCVNEFVHTFPYGEKINYYKGKQSFIVKKSNNNSADIFNVFLTIISLISCIINTRKLISIYKKKTPEIINVET